MRKSKSDINGNISLVFSITTPNDTFIARPGTIIDLQVSFESSGKSSKARGLLKVHDARHSSRLLKAQQPMELNVFRAQRALELILSTVRIVPTLAISPPFSRFLAKLCAKMRKIIKVFMKVKLKEKKINIYLRNSGFEAQKWRKVDEEVESSDAIKQR